MVAYLDLLKQE